MRVHFAAGEHAHHFPGWWNVDIQEGPDIDQVANLVPPHPLPANLKDIEAAYVGHFLEHLTRIEAAMFLSQIRLRTVPGAKLVVVGPDVKRAERMHRQGEMPRTLLEACQAHGETDPDKPWNRAGVHLWDCSDTDVAAMARSAGWVEVDILEISHQWPQDIPCIDLSPWQLLVVGRSPGASTHVPEHP